MPRSTARSPPRPGRLLRTCVWRIRIYRIDAAMIQVLRRRVESLSLRDARLCHYRQAPHRDGCQAAAPRRRSICRLRVAVAETSATDYESVTGQSAESATDRPHIASLCAGLMRPARLLRSAIVLKPSTLMAFHRALVNRKYRLLFAPRRRKPGPKGPSPELIAAIVEMKRRNPRFGCRRIAQQIAFVFGVEIDKDVVRRVLAKHCRPTNGTDGPSWLTVLGHATDSLWSVDLFRCESLSEDAVGDGGDGPVHPPHHRLRRPASGG